MGYLLDANAFIQSNQRHYGLELCPGYWEWIAHAHNKLKILGSVESIEDELSRQNDDLWTWASSLPTGFFQKPDLLVYAASVSVSSWAQSEPQYEEAARSKFYASGEYLLIAHAIAHAQTVVSYEQARPNAKARITVPDACRGLSVECITPFEMLKRESVKFVLEKPRKLPAKRSL